MDEILGISRLSSKFQVTIPKDARVLFNLKAGDRVVFVKEGDKLVIKKA